MLIDRILYDKIVNCLSEEQKVIVLYGARQVGKSTLINQIINDLNVKITYVNGDELRYHEVFISRDLNKLLELLDERTMMVIDEAQRIPNIGLSAKILHDANKQINIILTGSSSFDLSGKISEPLTGRKRTFNLFPISLEELQSQYSVFEIRQSISQFMIYGMYPEIITSKSPKQKRTTLRELASSYLFNDILQLTTIKHSDKLYKLLQLLALQIGKTVSLAKISNALDLSFETVERYIDLLEKAFVIFRLSGYSRNKSKEISKMDKIYFYDVGIRNAVLDNYSDIALRVDAGDLWENFIIAERMKYNSYHDKDKRMYFWRTYGGTEIDLIEEGDGKLLAYEIKYNNKVKKAPKAWSENYPDSTYYTINKDNYLQFVTTKHPS